MRHTHNSNYTNGREEDKVLIGKTKIKTDKYEGLVHQYKTLDGMRVWLEKQEGSRDLGVANLTEARKGCEVQD